jgi:hypothetical protein
MAETLLMYRQIKTTEGRNELRPPWIAVTPETQEQFLVRPYDVVGVRFIEPSV